MKRARPRARPRAASVVVLACALVPALGWVPRAGAREPIVTRFDIPDNRIAITFDACATKTHGYGFDRQVYQILQREHVPATIFVSGRWVEFHPGVMTQLAADPLIEFGNHSYDHPHMSRLGNDDIVREIDETEAVLGRYGKHGVAFRPPFGDFNARMLDVVRERGLPVVSWDVVSGDPAAATTTQGMIHEVGRRTRSGSIVIFHINGRGWKTAEALPSILRELKTRGFSFVHLSELLGVPSGGPVVVTAPASAPPAPAPAFVVDSFTPPPEMPPQIVPEPAAVQPPPFRTPAPARSPARAPDAAVIVETAGHAPTAAKMRWAAESAKHAPPPNRQPAEGPRAAPR